MRNEFKILCCAIALELTPASVGAERSLELEGGPERITLVELYTSQGCSSCPPADAWMSDLLEDERLWKSIVPLAFHVDYWDYIGWRDKFADPRFGARQRNYRRHGHVQSVYTPGFVVGGEEWRGWFNRPDLGVPEAPAPGVLAVTVGARGLAVRFSPTAAGRVDTPMVHVAVLGFGLSTRVTTGENHGRQLRHDFVVIGYGEGALNESGELLEASVPWPREVAQASRRALAVWVSDRDDPRPVQAVGGWL